MAVKVIGKVVATEKKPNTIDEFYFWTDIKTILSPFDVVKVAHIEDSNTYGVVEEISHITDTPNYLNSYISSDFGEIDTEMNTRRIGMNYVKTKVIGNDKFIYNPVFDGEKVTTATEDEIAYALGLDKIENKVQCGYLEMYERMGEEYRITLPVNFDSRFLIGPEGAHFNISGISGLATKTSYAMFILKALQAKYINEQDDSVAFVILNVKGKDLLQIDEKEEDKGRDVIYENLGIEPKPFENVKYFYPFDVNSDSNAFTYASDEHVCDQIKSNKAHLFKYVYEYDKDNLDLLFSNVDDPNQTIEAIVNLIIDGNQDFDRIDSWTKLKDLISRYGEPKGSPDKNIPAVSWRKFGRILGTAISSSVFTTRANEEKKEIRLKDAIKNISKNDVFVIDVAKLDENMQGFVFGDVMRAVNDLRLGQLNKDKNKIPKKIIIFVDELNKYASDDVPKSSPVLKQLREITERGRSLGIVLFSAEQFKSVIDSRIKGNCSTHAYGRTNAIELSKKDYSFIPPVFRNMMTRLEQGEYIIQSPIFRSLLNIKFPKPLYKESK